MQNFSQLVLMIVPLLFAVTIHEVAHGYVAYLMGDNTARLAGRLTLNPIKHLDPVGSILLPLILKLTGSGIIFGYAKPVPVNLNNLRDYRKGVLFVSAAGVTANIICAVASGLLFRILLYIGGMWQGGVEIVIAPLLNMMIYSVIINLVLTIFNLIPIPPLDGSKILAVFLPPDMSAQYQSIERYGMFIIIVLLMTDVLDKLLSGFVNPLSKLLLGY